MWPPLFSPQPFYISFFLYSSVHSSCRGSWIDTERQREKECLSPSVFFFISLFILAGWCLYHAKGPGKLHYCPLCWLIKPPSAALIDVWWWSWRPPGHSTPSLSACVGEVHLVVRPVSSWPSITCFFSSWWLAPSSSFQKPSIRVILLKHRCQTRYNYIWPARSKQNHYKSCCSAGTATCTANTWNPKMLCAIRTGCWFQDIFICIYLSWYEPLPAWHWMCWTMLLSPHILQVGKMSGFNTKTSITTTVDTEHCTAKEAAGAIVALAMADPEGWSDLWFHHGNDGAAWPLLYHL